MQNLYLNIQTYFFTLITEIFNRIYKKLPNILIYVEGSVIATNKVDKGIIRDNNKNKIILYLY